MDRSAPFQEFLKAVADKELRVREYLNQEASIKKWEAEHSGPATITGAYSAITCIRRQIPIFSVLANYITQQIFVACSAGNYVFDLSKFTANNLDLETIKQGGRKVFFHGLESNRHAEMHRFVTFMGKAGYAENFNDSGFMNPEEMNRFLHYNNPGGPSRALYLSDLQPKENQIGFILANGEKIGEWIHWLPFVRFARKEDEQDEPALRLYEIFHPRPWTKDGILMSTPPAYSVFKAIPGSANVVIDVDRFSYFENPSQIRSTLIVAPFDNYWTSRIISQYGYREILLEC